MVGGCEASEASGDRAVEAGEHRCFNDVRIFDTDTLGWSLEPMAGGVGGGPAPRGGHTVVPGAGLDLFVFGGVGADGSVLGDVHRLDALRRRWSRGAVPAAGLEHMPAARTAHGAASDEQGSIYVFGGRGGDGSLLDDLWVMSASSSTSRSLGCAAGSEDTFVVSWERISVRTAASGGHRGDEWPAPREGHSLTWVAGGRSGSGPMVAPSLVLFGGDLGDSGTAADVHVFDLGRRRWTKQIPGGSHPAPRRRHSAARYGGAIVVAGGCGRASGLVEPVCHDDVWLLDLNSMEWSRGPVGNSIWPGREGHSAIIARGQMLLIGGCRAPLSCFSDLGRVDTHTACPAQCGNHGLCINGDFCRCAAGFGGHDCARKLVCLVACGRHGHCAEDGRCACENGWAGDDCSLELLCPGVSQRCSGHGKCLLDGTCSCAAGFSGMDCSFGRAPRAVLSAPVEGPTRASHQQCPLACCGRGRCSGGTCVCEAGWFGPRCSTDVLTWRSLAVARRGGREALLETARGRRARADTAGLLAASLARAGAQGGSTRHRLASLLADAGTLAADAEASERLAAAALASAEPLFLDTCMVPVASATLVQISTSGSTERCLGGCSKDHGLCQDGVCYCQPAYGGAACTYKRHLRMIPGPLRAVEVVAVAFALVLLTGCSALGTANGRKDVAARGQPIP